MHSQPVINKPSCQTWCFHCMVNGSEIRTGDPSCPEVMPECRVSLVSGIEFYVFGQLWLDVVGKNLRTHWFSAENQFESLLVQTLRGHNFDLGNEVWWCGADAPEMSQASVRAQHCQFMNMSGALFSCHDTIHRNTRIKVKHASLFHRTSCSGCWKKTKHWSIPSYVAKMLVFSF